MRGCARSIAPGSGVIERTVDGGKVVTAAVGATDRVQVEARKAGDEMTRVTEPAVANFGPWVTVAPTLETTRAAFTFSFPEGAAGSLHGVFRKRADADRARSGECEIVEAHGRRGRGRRWRSC